MWEFLVAIQEELDTPQARLFGLVLKAPFDFRFGPGHRGLLWGHVVCHRFGNIRDFGGDLVACDSIAAWPALRTTVSLASGEDNHKGPFNLP